MKPTERQKQIYKQLYPIIGIEPKVIRYGDDINENFVFIMEVPDPIDKNVMFYSTIGLSDYEMKCEILFSAYKRNEEAGNIISSCAFFVMKEKWKLNKGVVFEDIVKMYNKSSEMKHIYFTEPYLWEDKLEDFQVNNEPVFFLLAIPISDKELIYKNEKGVEELENLFEKKGINIFDLNRKSVV